MMPELDERPAERGTPEYERQVRERVAKDLFWVGVITIPTAVIFALGPDLIYDYITDRRERIAARNYRLLKGL